MQLQERQAPIDVAIVNAMISSTPEHWNAIALRVDNDDSAGQSQLAVVIESPEGHREPVAPDDELYEAIYRLVDLYAEQSAMWKSVRYDASVTEDGNWRFGCEFAY